MAGWWAGAAGVALRVLLYWYAATALASVTNAFRTLAAHRYEGSGASRSRAAQLVDSVDVEGAWWTELWAPVGLRFHALHHYFPGIPYHNLRRAHECLLRELPAEAPYHHVMQSSLLAALTSLYARGRDNHRQSATT
jgi:fatty acid desaturase